MSGVSNITVSNPFLYPTNAVVGAPGLGANSPVQDTDGDFDASPATEAASLAASANASTASTSSTTQTGGTALRDQIVAAVKQAVAGFDPSGSLTDLRKTIQSAVNGVLQQNGIDPTQVQGHKGHRGHHHHGSVAPMPVQGTTTPDPATASSSSAPAGDAQDAKNALINTILGTTPGASSAGNDPGSEGDVNATLQAFLQNMPSGSVVDTQA